jgi:hypothetical protein
VVCRYADNVDPAQQSPAILEKIVREGRVLMLTTRLDSPWDPARKWNNYWDTAESSWGVVFPNMLGRYLAGGRDANRFNFFTGQGVVLRLPPIQPDVPRKIRLEGPGITEPDATPVIGASQTDWRWPAEKTQTPGFYELRTEDGSWRSPFSLTIPAEESDLNKVPDSALAEVLGADALIAAGKELSFREQLTRKLDAPLELFPWLLLLTLLLFCLEGYFANRFYRS